MKHPKKQHQLDAMDKEILDDIAQCQTIQRAQLPPYRAWAVYMQVIPPRQLVSVAALRRRILWLIKNGYLQKRKVRGTRHVELANNTLLRVVDPLARLTKIALKDQKEP